MKKEKNKKEESFKCVELVSTKKIKNDSKKG